MFRFFIIASILVLIAEANELKVRILNGLPAREGQFPYQVSLQLNGRHHCGGSIIAKNAIITAAHCVYGQIPQTLTVKAGTIYLNSGGVVAHVASCIPHPYYRPPGVDYDIAIVILAEHLPVDTNPNVKRIAMVDGTEPLLANEYATLSGWGQDSASPPQLFPGFGGSMPPQLPKNLKYAEIPLWERSRCAAVTQGYLTERMYCAGDAYGRITSCPGDSGGPLVKNGKLVGVVSWGFGCGANAPSVYTHLAVFRPWIRQNIGL